MDQNVQSARPGSTPKTGVLTIKGLRPEPDRNLSPGQRLKKVRIEAGFRSALEAARAMGMPVISYQHHENGRRGISRDQAAFYASYFGIPAGLLLYGDTHVLSVEVPIMGILADGGRFRDRAELPYNLPETTPAPPYMDAELLSVIVLSSDLYPAYRPGDVVFFNQLSHVKDKAMDGLECIVELWDGERLLRVIHRQTNGRFTLVSHNGSRMIDVVIKGAGAVRWVQRGAYRDIIGLAAPSPSK